MMVILREPDDVQVWNFVFWTSCDLPLARWIPGKFKHVAAFGIAPLCRTWVVIDRNWHGLDVKLYPDTQDSRLLLAQWTRDASVLVMQARRPAPAITRLGSWCVPAMRALAGVPGRSLTPSGFWNDCWNNGAAAL